MLEFRGKKHIKTSSGSFIFLLRAARNLFGKTSQNGGGRLDQQRDFFVCGSSQVLFIVATISVVGTKLMGPEIFSGPQTSAHTVQVLFQPVGSCKQWQKIVE